MKIYPRRHSQKGFTLIEIMIVVAITCLLATISIPNYLRARKRSQASRVLDEVRALDQAITQYTIEHNRTGTETIGPGDIAYFLPYIKTNSALYTSLPNDYFGNPFTLTTLDATPQVAIATFNGLSDVAPADFWSPYGP